MEENWKKCDRCNCDQFRVVTKVWGIEFHCVNCGFEDMIDDPNYDE